jgi:transcriptional regulator with XRE-family HTH domain
MADKETTKLKQVRSAKGITQKELADKTGVSIRTLQHYEQGSKDLTTAAAITVWKIAQALNCNIEDLIDC